ncbi:hypothetical protein AAGS40_25250 (plasmid) [Paraburkholderia sp. PREW-6R]|uniref:hypothetical protein n=1 Tax=Paraburkholderia sp. PREW-6R TaxID=3141544 RepID=UPI0031F5CB2F
MSNTVEAALAYTLEAIGDMTVAVSGGVDSMTLATLAHREAARTGAAVHVVHASSPAVPAEATARVRRLASDEGWSLTVIDAGEFASAQYRANPVNRCFFCKSALYETISAHTHSQIVSGANLDDLGEYRPGLLAARDHHVRHPFVEANVDKATVREIARRLGLGEIAELPAAPCLSSRIETGIRIEPASLEFVHAVEKLVASKLSPQTVRCRVRASGVVVELDSRSLTAMTPQIEAALRVEIERRYGLLQHRSVPATLGFAPYRTGSAFLTEQT